MATLPPHTQCIHTHTPHSDQSDPFNRAPLTADILQPIKELKLKIEQWKHQKLE